MAIAHPKVEEIGDLRVDSDGFGHDAPHTSPYFFDPDFPGDAYRYHNGGTAVLTAGVIAGMVAYCWGVLPAWGGFLAGAIPTFLLVALLYTTRDARNYNAT